MKEDDEVQVSQERESNELVLAFHLGFLRREAIAVQGEEERDVSPRLC